MHQKKKKKLTAHIFQVPHSASEEHQEMQVVRVQRGTVAALLYGDGTLLICLPYQHDHIFTIVCMRRLAVFVLHTTEMAVKKKKRTVHMQVHYSFIQRFLELRYCPPVHVLQRTNLTLLRVIESFCKSAAAHYLSSTLINITHRTLQVFVAMAAALYFFLLSAAPGLLCVQVYTFFFPSSQPDSANKPRPAVPLGQCSCAHP